MPIYAYRCESCGFDKDVLQKMSDAPLTQCPSCGADAFRKQVTAAGFQLKGSGWYVTDFRGGNSGKSGAATGAKAAGESASSESGKSAGEGAAVGSSGSSDSGAAAPATSTPAGTPASAPSPAAST